MSAGWQCLGLFWPKLLECLGRILCNLTSDQAVQVAVMQGLYSPPLQWVRQAGGTPPAPLSKREFYLIIGASLLASDDQLRTVESLCFLCAGWTNWPLYAEHYVIAVRVGLSVSVSYINLVKYFNKVCGLCGLCCVWTLLHKAGRWTPIFIIKTNNKLN